MNKYLEKIAEQIQYALVYAPYKFGDDHHWAASSRPLDKGGHGKISPPGGKVDPGETHREAAIREAAEEGWELEGLEEKPFHINHDGIHELHSFYAKSAKPRLDKWKELERGVVPVPATLDLFRSSHYHNSDPLPALKRKLSKS